MRDPRPKVLCEIVFLPQEEGGRPEPPPQWALRGHGCPHIVVEADEAGEYLGVVFVDGTGPAEAGEIMLALIEFTHHPQVDYSALVVGVAFTIREGGRVVGRGKAVG